MTEQQAITCVGYVHFARLPNTDTGLRIHGPYHEPMSHAPSGSIGGVEYRVRITFGDTPKFEFLSVRRYETQVVEEPIEQ